MYEQYGFGMPQRGATPWEAHVLYDFDDLLMLIKTKLG